VSTGKRRDIWRAKTSATSTSDQVDAIDAFSRPVDALEPEPRQLKIGTRQPEQPSENKRDAFTSIPPEVSHEVDAIDAFPVADIVTLTGASKQSIHQAIREGRINATEVVASSGHNKGRSEKRVSLDDTFFAAYPQARMAWTLKQAEAAAAAKAAEQKRNRQETLLNPPAPARNQTPVQSLLDWQRRRMDARLALINHWEKLRGELEAEDAAQSIIRHGQGEKAMRRLIYEAENSLLPAEIQALIPIANARSGQAGDRTLSRRTFQRWLADSRQGPECLAPKAREWVAPAWLPILLGFYRRPQAPSLASCVALLASSIPAGVRPPSIDAARRALAKIGSVERERGRMLPRELKTQKPFRRREKPEFPFDVLIADGHTFDAEVAHPLTGAPFRPEITTVVDVCTGRVVGWSAWEKECAWAVIDALRQAILVGGVPCIFYSDNGPGYVNARMDQLKARLGFQHHTGIPYNSQARGVVERLQKSLWVELAAKSFSTYVGASMDREARQIVFKATRKGVPVLPSWQNFVVFMDQCVEAYNARPHRACPKGLDADGRKRHLSPMGYWEHLAGLGWQPEGLPVTLDDFRPEEVRTVLRGEINLFGNRYFSNELAELNKDKVRVAFDIHDASRIWVSTLDGAFVCEAGFQANSCAYFPKPYVETLRAQRKEGQRKRLEAKAERVLGEPQAPVEIEELSLQTLEHSSAQMRKLGLEEPPAPETEAAKPAPEPRRRPIFADEREYALWVLDHQDQADPEELAAIHSRMRKDALYCHWLGREAATA